MSSSMQSIRHDNLSFLKQNGFEAAEWLPLMPEAGTEVPTGEIGGVVRPLQEIAQKYLSLVSLFAWATGPSEMSNLLADFIERNQLTSYMNDDELQIVRYDKDSAVEQFQGMVGWKLENMWPLAWVLGMAPIPSAVEGQVHGDLVREMMGAFMPDFSMTVTQLVENAQLKTTQEIVATHDLFYCAHNAVRSAQVGGQTVPEYFHPLSDGGAIHERRHSLSWVLSPGTRWDEVDLST